MRRTACLPLLAIAAVFLPATAPPLAMAGPAKRAHAPAKTAPEPEPAPEPIPVADVPRVSFETTASGLVADVILSPIRADAVSIVFVAAPLPNGAGDIGNASELPCSSTVIGELDAALLADAPPGVVQLSVPVPLDATKLPKSDLYAIRPCTRTSSGALVGSDDGFGTIESFSRRPAADAPFGATVDTPSGRITSMLLERGFSVIGYDVEKGAEVVERVHAATPRTKGHLSIDVEGIGTVTSTKSRAYYVPAKHRFVDASALLVGDEIFVRGGGTAKVTAAAAPTQNLDAMDVKLDGPGDYFASGLLVRDEKPAKGEAAAYAEATESSSWIAEPMSYDCTLTSTLSLGGLPTGARSVVLVVKKQAKHPGARVELSCDDGTPALELSAKVVDRVKLAEGTTAETRILVDQGSEDSGPFECDTGYSMLACYRDANGKLAPLDSNKARYGKTGSSCFVAGTPIATPAGDAAIETLVPGERIYGYDVEGRALGTVRVTHVTPRTKYDLGAVTLSNGTELRVTSEHPFFVRGLGFVAAHELEIGDRLLQVDGSEVEVERIAPFDGEGEVFDVSVDGPHDYFAGGVLVHNY